jgi:O-antigen/teichoic acid export membrane protein
MMKSKSSVSSRFAITAIFNAGKVTLAFLTGTVIARVLGPKQCGDYMFLLGSFLGIRQLLNLETSAAFYTFLCQKPRSSKFILSYIAWQLLQLTITILIIEFILPDSIIEQIWIQQDRKHILIALLGVFFMQQISLTVTQIGESLRKTQRTQALSFFMNLLQFISILLLSISGHLSISSIFTSMSIIAALSFLVSFIMIPIPLVKEMPSVSISEMVEQYTKYCSPLIINAGLTFIYIFSDKWLLQKYGGSREQAFYSVSYQLAAIGFFAAEAANKHFLERNC